jgi:hypothetical protein
MDLRGLRHYVAPAMEFLLILSAILSAVTGAVTGVRAPEARLHHAAAVQAEAPPAGQTVRVAKIEARIPDAAPRASAVFFARAFALPAAIPLYASRLIE